MEIEWRVQPHPCLIRNLSQEPELEMPTIILNNSIYQCWNIASTE